MTGNTDGRRGAFLGMTAAVIETPSERRRRAVHSIEPSPAARVARWAEAYRLALYGYALRLVGDGALAEDIVQGAFVVALERSDATVPAASERAWLFGIARKLAARAFRARKGVLAVLSRAEPDFEAGRLIDTAPAREEDGADQRALGAERRHVLAGALQELPARQREVLFLVFNEGLTVDEAAHAMGISPGAARQHYHRAKEALRGRLAGRGELI
jgi:RNA polymerase sigma-70 factor (ECF subfamily)